MSCIRILPEHIANRIAAGEVIERPASVVKELLENSIDAGATRITVQCQRGGASSILVTDNACGMDRDDAMLCISAHATSKVREAEDIARVSTLGFRGEALASIAAVSRFNLQTRRPEDVAGTEIVVDSGTLRDVRECGCAPGTSVRIRNIFGNLPARRKFLRSKATEEDHIRESVLIQALAHESIAFELLFDDKTVLQAAPTTDMAARAAMLLGRDVVSGMLPIAYDEEGIRVTGLAARPGLTRSARRDQRVFVNSRPAAAPTVFTGIREAYHTLVMKGRYPPVLLFLELDPERVDVNVHPAKREVRFREPRLVGQIVGAALRRALRQLAATGVPLGQDNLPAQPRPVRARFDTGKPHAAGPEQQSFPMRPLRHYAPPFHQPRSLNPTLLPMR